MSDWSDRGSVVVPAAPDDVYALVSDVTRTGEWSPICTACWWDEGAGPRVGAWFTGRNETPSRVWETRSQVVAADPGREFAWLVEGRYTRWGYTMSAVGDGAETGTELTETWEFLPAGRDRFAELYGEHADEQMADRREAAHTGIPETLAALARILG